MSNFITANLLQQSSGRMQFCKLSWELYWLPPLLSVCSFDGQHIEASESSDRRSVSITKKYPRFLKLKIVSALVRSSYICGLKADETLGTVIPSVCCPQEASSVIVTSASIENVTQISASRTDISEGGESLRLEEARRHLGHPDACGISLVHDRDNIPEAGEARLGQHPWVAILAHQDSETRNCFGSIIGPRV